eukprot:GHRR01024862.1.p1 GENE.GHRR01024862.1~~GHRR01024862.1.p1  ORF type:complete len:247 (+),score=51.19 GHRR01024862.1:232-972(+)
MSTLSPGLSTAPDTAAGCLTQTSDRTARPSMPPSNQREIAKRKSTAPTWSQICKSLVAGGVAGGLSRTAVAPLERLKILMQVQGNEKIYRGVWQGLLHMAKTEGVKGMMKGNWTNCVRIVPNSAIKFFTYEQLSRHIADHRLETTGSSQLTPVLRLMAGAGAGIVAMSATYPLDMVRGRLTVQEGRNVQYSGIIHAARTILKEVRQQHTKVPGVWWGAGMQTIPAVSVDGTVKLISQLINTVVLAL